jgi:hypothetical protein
MVINLEPEERIKEGQMYGTELSLSSMEKLAEECLGLLPMDIFIEIIYFSM